MKMRSIPDEALEKLKCSSCGEYLSVLPILIQKDTGKSICGRCPVSEDQTNNYVRNIALEEFVKFLNFPCKYQQQKCKKLLYPEETVQHEKLCSFQTFSCPLGEECSWTGTSLKLAPHCAELHDELVIKNDRVQLDFKEDFKKTFLLTFEDENFIITLKYCNLQLNSVAYYLGSKRYEVYNFDLVLSRINLRYVRVLPIPCCSFFEREDILFSSYTFKENPSHSLSAQITVTKTYLNLTITVKCFYCNKKAYGKICVCESGHEICPKCLDEHKNKCGETVREVLQNFKFHCKNEKRGCPYTAEDYEMFSNHGKNCIFNNNFEIKCLKCNDVFKGFYTFAPSHSKKCLPYVVMDETITNWSPFPSTLYSTLCFDNYIFKINIDTKSVTAYKLTVELLFQKDVSQKYQFEVEFVKWNNFEDVVLLQRQRVSDKENTYTALVDPNTVSDAMNNDHIYFKIRILKN